MLEWEMQTGMRYRDVLAKRRGNEIRNIDDLIDSNWR